MSYAEWPSTTAALVIIGGQEGPAGTYNPDAMTCQQPQRPDDRTAKQLVQLCLREVEVCLHDDGSQPMMHDLDLRWPDGHIEAMEVTVAIDDALLRLDLRLARHGSMIPAKESTRQWTLMLASGSSEVRVVRDQADHLLCLVEQAGVTGFGWDDEHESVAAARVLCRLGVAHGVSFNPPGSRRRSRSWGRDRRGSTSNPSRSTRWSRNMPAATR
jgi:hypothetical protein